MRPINLVALIDDDEIVNFIESRIIESTNLVDRIKTFLNGQEAIDFLIKNSDTPDLLPEIILLDLNMPIMDGFEFLKQYILLKPRLGKKIHIYVVSSAVTAPEIERIHQIKEVSDYIIKPITKERFEKIVSVLVNNQSK
jgi:response regulator of citrate/malate metabolism